MTYLFPFAFILLIGLVYCSSIFAFIPSAFGYLLFLYSLHELPKSKTKTSFIVLSIFGFILSLLPFSTILMQYFIIIILLCILTYQLEKQRLTFAFPALFVPLCFMANKMNTNKIIAFSVILMICLYFIFKSLNQYMQSFKEYPTYQKQKQYPFVLKSSLFIFLILGTLFGYQELQFATSKQTQSAIRYEVEENELDIDQYFNLIIYNNGKSWSNFTRLMLPKYLLENDQYHVNFKTVDNKPIASFYFEKNDLLEAIQEETFDLTEFYQKTVESWQSDSGYSSFFDLPSEFYIHISSDDGSDTFAKLHVTSQNALIEGRTLFVRASLYMSGFSELEVNFSILLEPLLNQCASVHYQLYEINETTQKETLLFDQIHAFNLFDFATDLFLNDLCSIENMDIEKNKYVLDIELFDDFNESLFKTRMVLKP